VPARERSDDEHLADFIAHADRAGTPHTKAVARAVVRLRSELSQLRADECHANTRLIASAPDMLVTLEKCIAALEAMDRCYATRLNEEDGEVLLEACAVVAKAKGEKP
jgi:hypothetical protein